MGIIANFNLYRRAKGAWKQFKGELMLEGIGTPVKRLVLIVAPPVVAYVTAACPALFSYSGLFSLGGAVLAGVMSGRKGQTATTSAATGAATLGVGSLGAFALAYTAGKGWIDQTCGTTFLQQLPTLLMTALSMALAAYMKGRKKEAQKEDLS